MWIQWHSGHAVGIESVDAKQRDLLHRTNRLVETVRAGRVDEAVTRLELLRGRRRGAVRRGGGTPP